MPLLLLFGGESGTSPVERGPISLITLDDGRETVELNDDGRAMYTLRDDGAISAVLDDVAIRLSLPDDGTLDASLRDSRITAVLEDGMAFFAKLGQTWKHLRFVLSDADGPIDFSTATGTINVRPKGGGPDVVTAQAVTLGPAPGQVDYDWENGAPTVADSYLGEVHVVFGDGREFWAPVPDYIPIEIQPHL